MAEPNSSAKLFGFGRTLGVGYLSKDRYFVEENLIYC